MGISNFFCNVSKLGGRGFATLIDLQVSDQPIWTLIPTASQGHMAFRFSKGRNAYIMRQRNDQNEITNAEAEAHVDVGKAES